MTIVSIVEQVKNGSMTARQTVTMALEKARATKDSNALLSLTESRALLCANVVDARIAAGEDVGILAGVPFVAKDNFLTFGSPTTAASKILQNFEAPLQATAIKKLEDAGAICIGKANLDAFAHGGSTENSAYGPTKNAHDPTKVAGGSSGGSAVAVALDIVPFALGSDTGGSIRQPASFNGVVGLKPTYGAISRFGVVAMASSTDCVGCFARTSADVELLMEVMAGRDRHDATTLPEFFHRQPQAASGQKIGIIKQFMDEGVDPEVRQRTIEYVDRLTAKGHVVEEVDLPILKYALAMYYIIVPAEVTSNLARYDGIRYGKRSSAAVNLADVYGKSRDEGFELENKRRIMIGSYVLSSGYFDAYYMQAQKARTLLIAALDAAFAHYDALIGPTAPTPAFGLGENVSDPVKMYLSDIMTVPASLAGLPALSVPAGVTSTGMPVGVQLIGKRQSDAALLALAREMEEA